MAAILAPVDAMLSQGLRPGLRFFRASSAARGEKFGLAPRIRPPALTVTVQLASRTNPATAILGIWEVDHRLLRTCERIAQFGKTIWFSQSMSRLQPVLFVGGLGVV